MKLYKELHSHWISGKEHKYINLKKQASSHKNSTSRQSIAQDGQDFNSTRQIDLQAEFFSTNVDIVSRTSWAQNIREGKQKYEEKV